MEQAQAVGRLILQAIDAGLEVAVGPHQTNTGQSIEGYWAVLHKSEAFSVRSENWYDAGHGFTIAEALEDALTMSDEQRKTTRAPEEFIH